MTWGLSSLSESRPADWSSIGMDELQIGQPGLVSEVGGGAGRPVPNAGAFECPLR